MNDPRMSLLPEDYQEAIGKQAFYKGLTDMGMGLLAQSGFQEGPAPTIGEAIGKAAPAFQEGVSGVVEQGLLVSEEQKKRETEADRLARMGEFTESAFLTPAEQKTLQFAIDTGNEALQTDLLKKRERQSLIAKINPSDFTSESLQKFLNPFQDLFHRLTWVQYLLLQKNTLYQK